MNAVSTDATIAMMMTTATMIGKVLGLSFW